MKLYTNLLLMHQEKQHLRIQMIMILILIMMTVVMNGHLTIHNGIPQQIQLQEMYMNLIV